MVKDGDDERRSSPRIRLRRGVTLTIRGFSFDTHTINVSRGGVSVEMLAPPERGARGTIMMPLSEGAPLDFQAEVRWSSPLSTMSPAGTDTRHLVGLQFIDPAPEAVARLAAALEAEEEDETLDG